MASTPHNTPPSTGLSSGPSAPPEAPRPDAPQPLARKEKLREALRTAVIVLLLAAAYVGMNAVSRRGGEALPGTKVGSHAPHFSLDTVDGGTLEMEALHGNVVLLVFWATWCAPCVAEIPNLKAIHERYAARGVVVVGVNQEGDQRDKVARFVSAREMKYPVVYDNGSVARAYGLSSLPSTAIIGADGNVSYKVTGAMSRASMARRIDALLASRDAATLEGGG